MSNRLKALKALSAANLETVKDAQEFLKQYNECLITSDECYTKLKKLFYADFKEEQDYGTANVMQLSK